MEREMRERCIIYFTVATVYNKLNLYYNEKMEHQYYHMITFLLDKYELELLAL